MLLSYTELNELVERGVIEGVHPQAINSASIDVRLGEGLMEEVPRRTQPWRAKPIAVDLGKRQSPTLRRVSIPMVRGYHLRPGQFVLGATMERFNLPLDISAQFLLKSSMARCGLDHLSATWMDAGWCGSVLTLELRNVTEHHALILRTGMYIGQVKFYRHTPVPEEASYARRGRYNGDSTVTAIKP